MALSLGSALATKVYLGATEINLAYFGATQVYTSSAFSAEAQNYFDRLDTAGDTTYTAYRQPIANYIDGLIYQGIWDSLESSALFVGVGFEGISVPLRSDMPTIDPLNFITTDQNVLTGLKGNASTKILKTGVIDMTSLAQDDVSQSIYITEAQTAGAFAVGTQSLGIGMRPSDGSYYLHTGGLATGGAWTTGFFGQTRNDPISITYRRDDASNFTTQGATSSPKTATEISIFGYGVSASSNARLATYTLGADVNLTRLNKLQSNLVAEVNGQAPVPLEDPIFILAQGQSNIAGILSNFGTNSEANPDVYILNNAPDPSGSTANPNTFTWDTWVPKTDPIQILNSARNPPHAVFQFAKKLQEETNREVRVVVNAKSSVSITEFVTVANGGSGTMWDELSPILTAANIPAGAIDFHIWGLGETDSLNGENPLTWFKPRFELVRSQVEGLSETSNNLVTATLEQLATPAGVDAMNTYWNTLKTDTSGKYVVIECQNETPYADNIHYSAAAAINIGQVLLWNAWDTLN